MYFAEHLLFNKEIPEKKLLPIGIVHAENVDSFLD